MENTSGKPSAEPHLALAGVQIFFGSLPVIGKFVLKVLPPLALVGFRVGITAALLAVVQAYRGRLWLKVPKDYFKLAILSLFGVTFNQLFFVSGLSLTKASNTSLLAVTIPIFALTTGRIAGTEILRGAKVIGIGLAATGVILLLDPRQASFSSSTTTGDILIVINSLSYGIYVATSKETIMRNGVFRSMMWVFIFATIVCVPLGMYSLMSVDLKRVGLAIWELVFYIGIGATALPYILNAWALARVSPSTVAVYIYLQPLIGFLCAVIFLGEKIDLRFAAAAILIFMGVYFVTKRHEVALG